MPAEDIYKHFKQYTKLKSGAAGSRTLVQTYSP